MWDVHYLSPPKKSVFQEAAARDKTCPVTKQIMRSKTFEDLSPYSPPGNRVGHPDGIPDPHVVHPHDVTPATRHGRRACSSRGPDPTPPRFLFCGLIILCMCEPRLILTENPCGAGRAPVSLVERRRFAPAIFGRPNSRARHALPARSQLPPPAPTGQRGKP